MTSGGGSRCTTPEACFGTDEYYMCRSDDDCRGIEHCVPADRQSYFDGKAAVCDL
jgi:hypothetical protein